MTASCGRTSHPWWTTPGTNRPRSPIEASAKFCVGKFVLFRSQKIGKVSISISTGQRKKIFTKLADSVEILIRVEMVAQIPHHRKVRGSIPAVVRHFLESGAVSKLF